MIRAVSYTIAAVGWLLLIVACDKSAEPEVISAPPGFERTTTGSGCREIATGKYVDKENCDPLINEAEGGAIP